MSPLSSSSIPEKTVERLSEYRRTLYDCYRKGITHIYSHVLAAIHDITAVQVRRDLMLIGFSSDTKKGYDVKVLIGFISDILDSPSPQKVAVIGMGHMGHAITKYFNDKKANLRFVVAFDSDPQKTGRTEEGIPCYPPERFEEIIQRMEINMVMLSVPAADAPSYVLPIINAGIKGVFNFTSARLNFPLGIYVENFDITTALEKLAYFVKESENN